MFRAFLSLLCISALAAPSAAQVTRFSEDVSRAIDQGLESLAGRGAFANPSPSGEAAGLVALALLEKRESADQEADRTGYSNARPQDKARLDQIMAFIIARA
ncbi:hypothetical protein KKF91_06705, partial [Myxococcota bacterium]|nr:hypothetical protein [Myxococcota bacterium]